jgi:hypothetical protein
MLLAMPLMEEVLFMGREAVLGLLGPQKVLVILFKEA